MSLRTFHGFFITLCLALFSFTGYWATGRNSSGVKMPWLLGASLAGTAMMAPYLYWYLKKVRLPR
jgi:uncharacterized membrane protein